MDVVIFCVCQGGRMREEAEYRPKPMVEVGGRWQVWYHGTREPFGFEVALANAGVDTMTGGRVKRFEQQVKADPFIVTYCDGVSNVDIRKLVAFRKSHGKPQRVAGDLPGADSIMRRMLCLGVYSVLTNAHVDHLIATVAGYVRSLS